MSKDVNCPLCGNSEAASREVSSDELRYDCPGGHEFVIHTSSARRLKEMPEEFRSRHAKHAAGSNDDRIWVIRPPNADELKTEPSTTMVGEFHYFKQASADRN